VDGCKGRAQSAVLEDGTTSIELEERQPHTNCEPNPALANKKTRIKELKQLAVENPLTPASQLIEKLKQPLTFVEKLALPSDHGLEMHVHNARKPEGADMIDADPELIVWHDFFTTTQRGDKFLVFDSRETEPEKPIIFIFASPNAIEKLKSH
jgi:hypothetical protein